MRVLLQVSFFRVGLMALLAVAFLDGTTLAQSTPPEPPVSLSYDWYQPSFWMAIDGRPVEESWQFSDQELQLVNPRGGGGSLLSPPVPENFELSFSWKIESQANSGLKYRVRLYEDRWLGIEYQMIDEPERLPAPHPGSTASIYDLIAPTLDKPLLPPGQWNEARIIASGNRLEHHLNGKLVASVQIDQMPWQAALARSKFYGRSGFGEPRLGDRIMLTDHGGKTAYRNFKLIKLPSSAPREQATSKPPQLGNGFRNGWADQNSIVLWTRTTSHPEMNQSGKRFVSLPKERVKALSQETDADILLDAQLPEGARLDEMVGACPGAVGEIRLTYFPVKQRDLAIATDWVVTSAENDFAHQWKLTDLQSGTQYIAIVEARAPGTEELTAVLRGHFRTAPDENSPAEVSFCMTTCHDYYRRDDGDSGHLIYPTMQAMAPDFVVHAGDIEYYDIPDPWAWTVDLMRFKWARLFALPNNREFYTNHTSYFIKDDHDTLKNDCWAGQSYGAVTFEEGVRIFNEEQFPSKNPRYATMRWGKDLQIWLLEGRDFRSPNVMPDGPEKTILGKEQKSWLIQTLKQSQSSFKLIFSPTPIVGPDRARKEDNHANENFTYEGDELRELFSQLDNVIVFCGDRHWQYASMDSTTGLWEFGCGPGSRVHQLGWEEGDFRSEHRFLRVQGGFLSGRLHYPGVPDQEESPVLTIRHHDVDGATFSQFNFHP
jgi:phosphodiesterase/alkaline phosphatase D-like protein